jgi:hypothetical protein
MQTYLQFRIQSMQALCESDRAGSLQIVIRTHSSRFPDSRARMHRWRLRNLHHRSLRHSSIQGSPRQSTLPGPPPQFPRSGPAPAVDRKSNARYVRFLTRLARPIGTIRCLRKSNQLHIRHTSTSRMKDATISIMSRGQNAVTSKKTAAKAIKNQYCLGLVRYQ